MIQYDSKYFTSFKFAKEQTVKHYENALKDLNIAIEDKILDVKFNYSYTALIKSGVALLSFHQIKAKNALGHHFKIIEMLASILKDDNISVLGNIMRNKRNVGLYAGGMIVTEKECKDYLEFVIDVLKRVKTILDKHKI